LKGGEQVKLFDMKRLDEKGRVLITNTIRKELGFKEGECLALYVRDGKLVVEKFNIFINKGEK
jgi:AbrB family looped-hinge helix DNA binding protein